ncbi:hypothetical protein K2173_000077 [Erythroxylum novogranatense]|uniref:Uncharacterized protein n=1 Tax=Erythroxylum novogranatense TaxID=1862640 RepID=A0AAV8SNP5_9ROSI|nr:hypothetical protein K2173_000077 [Erythroxylum novogranatense]
MPPIEVVIQVQGNIINARAVEVGNAKGSTGLHDIDEFVQSQLVLALQLVLASICTTSISPPGKGGKPFGADDLDCTSEWLEGANKVYIPFPACGDHSCYDSDQSYQMPKAADSTNQSLDPVQPSSAPLYKRALESKKRSLLW